MCESLPSKDEQNRLTNTALRLLARREYSRGELSERLARSSSDSNLISQVLDTLSRQGLQSDERFTENFIKYRIDQGKGPIKIRQDLRLKQISDDNIERFLDQNPEFWADLASSVYSRKYGNEPLSGDKDLAKRLRFMVSRGFSAQAVYSLIESYQSQYA